MSKAIPGGGLGRNSVWKFRGEDGYRSPKEREGGGMRSTDTGLLGFSPRTAEFDGYRVQNGERAETDVSGTSIFDPVLCELAYGWFCPPGGTVLDPFAGGSVRGIVAAKLGRPYIGVDLRAEQIEANRAQVPGIIHPDEPEPVWHVGDSRCIGEICEGLAADFVFSCPPYMDLERYSDDPADLSTLPAEAFAEAYREIIAGAVSLLAPNRFACFVVGDVRDSKGYYRGLPALTVDAFEDAGARFYNDAVLVTAVGSLPVRAGRQFVIGRKLGKTHQNVLVFCKGDWRKAAKACNGGAEA